VLPVREMGGEPVFDLLDRQMGTSKTVHGAIVIDGRPHSPSIPKSLRILKPPRSRGSRVYRPNPDELKNYEEKIAKRELYALLPHGRPTADMKLVFQCPGAAGRLACLLQAPKVSPRPWILPINTQPAKALPHSVCASRYKTFDLATDIPLYQRDVYGPTAWRKSYARRGTGVEPHFGALKDEAVAGFTRGKVRMRGIVKTGLMVAAAVAVTNRRFAMAWDRNQAPSPHGRKARDKLRDPCHHRLTRITREVGNTIEVLHPLTT